MLSRAPARKVGRVQGLKFWIEDLLTNRRQEIFFALIASFALSQVVYREYLLRSRFNEQKESTPQRKSRTVVEEPAPGSPRAKWSLRKDS